MIKCHPLHRPQDLKVPATKVCSANCDPGRDPVCGLARIMELLLLNVMAAPVMSNLENCTRMPSGLLHDAG